MPKARLKAPEFLPSSRVLYAEYERIRLAFRAPLNVRRSLKVDPAKILERLLDERATIDGKTATKRELIIANLIELAGRGDRAASRLLGKFLDKQEEVRGEKSYSRLFVNEEVLQHVIEKLNGQ